MMNIKKELPLLVIVSLPFFYLAYIWNQLPEKVPLHWNVNGEADRYGDKAELIIIPIILPLFVYLTFLIIPKIDPKGKLKNMGNKLQSIKFLVTTFMSVLALFILYTAKSQSFTNPNYIVLLIGVLYTILGNYFKTIKTNYFIGIRTPWTLESEAVWKATHELGGKLWFVSGIVVVLLSLVLETQVNFIIFLVITGIITIVPIAFSYVFFTREKNNELDKA